MSRHVLTPADVATLDAMVGEWEADGLDGSARDLAERIKASLAPAPPIAPHVPETCVTCGEFPAEFGNVCIACDNEEHGEVKEAEQARISLRASAARHAATVAP